MSWGQKKIHPQKAGGSQRGLERRSRNKGVVIKFINIPLKTFKNALFTTSFQSSEAHERGLFIIMAIRVVEFSNGGTKVESFLPKNQHTQTKLRCQKLGIILESKVIQKLMLSKNVHYKKCTPKMIFFNEKN